MHYEGVGIGSELAMGPKHAIELKLPLACYPSNGLSKTVALVLGL